jgi:hypothetical protein
LHPAAGWHESAVRLVAAGECDASAINSHLLAVGPSTMRDRDYDDLRRMSDAAVTAGWQSLD